MDIQRVGVVGCGLMGSGIVEAAARADLDVRVVDLDQASLDRGRQRISDSIGRAQKAAKLSESEAEAAIANIEYSADLGSLADRQLVVETEDKAMGFWGGSGWERQGHRVRFVRG